MTRDRLVACAACAAPGVLAGIHVTGLLFFLNPHLPFLPWPVARTAATCGLFGALVTVVVLLPVFWRRPEGATRFLPWSAAAVFGAAAVLDLAHAARFEHYVPPGLHDRLIKAGLWLGLAAVVTAWTAFAHSFRRRRPYGSRSRFGIAGLAVLTVYSVFERREAFDPPPPMTPRSAAIEPDPPRSLLIVGLDGASLDVILPLSEQGLLPFFSETMRSGSYGRAESIEPAVRLSLWTTVVTGKLPYRHGVVAEETRGVPGLPGERLHLTPRAIAFGLWGDRAVGDEPPALHPSAPTLWQIASGFGVEAFAFDFGVGLTGAPTARAAALGSAMADERLARLGDGPPSALYSAALRDLETQSQLLGVLDSREGNDSPLVLFALMDGLATVSPLYYDAYEAVQFDGDQAQVRLDRARWLSAYYAFLDGLVSEAWDRLPPPRMLAVVSGHGFRRSGPVRRLLGLWSDGSMTAGALQTPDGVLLLRGQGIRDDVLLTRIGVQDVTPTLLYAMNLPVAHDMDGSVITEAFDPSILSRRPITVVPSYETTGQAP